MPLAPGLLPGILAGSNTATPGLGAAQVAYAAKHAAANADTLATLSTSFAFAYCLSTVLFVLLSKLPDLFGRDTARAGREFEESLRQSSGSAPLPGTADEFMGGPLPVARRSYQLEKPEPVGHRLGELRRTYPLVAIERVLRSGQLLEPADDVVLQPHDTLALYGRVPRLLNAASVIGPEVDVPELGDIGSETVDVVAQRGDARGQDDSRARQRRRPRPVPERDVPRRRPDPVGAGHASSGAATSCASRAASGASRRWRRTWAASSRPSVSTDIVTLALGVSAGSLLGALTIPIGGLKLTVGSAVGLLVVGIVLSILRTRQPGFGGPFPEPARQLLEDLGLNIFVVVMGLNAGGGVMKALSGGRAGAHPDRHAGRRVPSGDRRLGRGGVPCSR